ncbi:type I methionyl aminopeptidase [Synechococcus sp. W65.1]|jgi:methionyl aminopeptidase|uniref:type I methionyl aminopeptidase n=1 Tax=unclassified Synechococcus TaxID=2626047 RepID=UPI0039C29FE3
MTKASKPGLGSSRRGLQLGEIKSRREVEKMRRAGRVVAQVLQEIAERLEPGWTTADIDAYAERRVAELNALPSFKGYYGFPACVCVSINHEVVHGIPSPRKVVQPGDIVKVDFGAMVEGWHADSCITIGLEPLSDAARDLIDTAAQALQVGIEHVRHGVWLQDVSGAIEDYVRRRGYSVVRQYVGHGVGRNLHEEPQFPHYRTPELPNPKLRAGMTLAIEPMVTAGGEATRVLPDRWTVVTVDGSWSAQFEHTILVTEAGAEILTDRTPFQS